MHWNSQHLPHLSWAVFPHLCWSSNITASPHEHLLQAEGRTPRFTSLRFHIVSCFTHLSSTPSNPEITPSYDMKYGPLSRSLMEKLSGAKKQDMVWKTPTIPFLHWVRIYLIPGCRSWSFSFRRVGVNLDVWRSSERTVWGVSVSRGRVDQLPRWTCSVPPSQPLIGCSHGWGKEILPIGNNWCFVAGPSCPDTKLTFIGDQLLFRFWKGDT